MHDFKNLTAIKDPEVKKFIMSIDSMNFLYDLDLINTFKQNFVEWISSSKLNNFLNITSFNNVQITNGSVHIFDHFYIKHKNKTFRLFDGEFMYHRAALKNNYNFGRVDETLKTTKNNAFIMSVPFTGYGKIHTEFFYWLEVCEKYNIPVLLDFCHATVSKNINIDFDNYSCIDTLAFSISKSFYGAEHLRVGIRLQRENSDDGIDILNSKGIQMLNLLSIGVANELILKYPFDFNWLNYGAIYKKICDQLQLEYTDNILMGIGNKQYDAYNRSGVNRLCLSGEISRQLSVS